MALQKQTDLISESQIKVNNNTQVIDRADGRGNNNINFSYIYINNLQQI